MLFRHLDNHEALYERCWVADVIIETDPEILAANDYDPGGTILPANFRKPTPHELTEVIAPKEYDEPTIDLCRVPLRLGQEALRLSAESAERGTVITLNDSGLAGKYMGVQHAAPNMRVATWAPNLGVRVGMHFDSWRHPTFLPGVTLARANAFSASRQASPGKKWVIGGPP